MKVRSWNGWGSAALVWLLAGCAGSAAPPAIVPATPAAPVAAAPAAHPAVHADTSAGPRYTAADVRFMQEMMGHHAQALELAALVPSRSARPELRLLAERIDVSQRDEIASMQRWLRVRGEAVPETAAHHAHEHGQMMPGMLSPEEMAALAATRGEVFERGFLASMIRHHEGALVMVSALFATSGAGQEPEFFAFANEVDADQRAEIARMRQLLVRLAPSP